MKKTEPELIVQLKRDHANMRCVIDVLGRQLEHYQQTRKIPDDLLAELADWMSFSRN